LAGDYRECGSITDFIWDGEEYTAVHGEEHGNEHGEEHADERTNEHEEEQNAEEHAADEDKDGDSEAHTDGHARALQTDAHTDEHSDEHATDAHSDENGDEHGDADEGRYGHKDFTGPEAVFFVPVYPKFDNTTVSFQACCVRYIALHPVLQPSHFCH
jgi:hypothetical protein